MNKINIRSFPLKPVFFLLLRFFNPTNKPRDYSPLLLRAYICIVGTSILPELHRDPVRSGNQVPPADTLDVDDLILFPSKHDEINIISSCYLSLSNICTTQNCC